MNVLRPSLLPGLLEALQRNSSRKNEDVAFFEVGRVFLPAKETAREERRLALALTGHRNPGFWQGEERAAKMDVFDLKGLLETFFGALGLRGATYNREPEGSRFFVESAGIYLGKLKLGLMGQLSPQAAKLFDLRDAVLLAELNLDHVLARRSTARSFKPLPSFPAIRRDVAMVVPETVSHEAVLSVVKQSKPAFLEEVELFDVFRGKNIPAGQKSLAYAFTYRHLERTLTDAEVNAIHEKVVGQFKAQLQAVVRDS